MLENLTEEQIESTRLEDIDVVRKENGKIHILGRNGEYGKIYNHIIYDAQTGELLKQNSFERYYCVAKNIPMGILWSLMTFGFGIRRAISDLFGDGYDKSTETEIYEWNIEKFREANVADLKDIVKDIKIYRGSIEEAERELGTLELAKTKNPSRFIQAWGKTHYLGGSQLDASQFWLKVRAHELRANAIVNYSYNSETGESYGTPVKYKE